MLRDRTPFSVSLEPMDRGERVSRGSASRSCRAWQHTVFAGVYANLIRIYARFDGRCSPLITYLCDKASSDIAIDQFGTSLLDLQQRLISAYSISYRIIRKHNHRYTVLSWQVVVCVQNLAQKCTTK